MFATVKPTPYEGEPWCFDNGAFRCWQDGNLFDDCKFAARLEVALQIGRPYLAVVPDIVAAGCSSLGFSLKWREKLPNEWPWYLAVQDGMTIHDVKPYLGLFDGVFLGGSDEFKRQAWRWRVFAKDHGKPFHYGRAGTISKLESALKMKADSLDSAYPLWEKSRFARFQKMYAYLSENPRPILCARTMGLEI